MALTGKQRGHLKSLGQTMDESLRLGKAGINDEFRRHLDRLLNERELVKLRFTDIEGAMRKELGREVCAASGAELVQIVGRTMLLYRANPALDADKRVTLPGSDSADA